MWVTPQRYPAAIFFLSPRAACAISLPRALAPGWLLPLHFHWLTRALPSQSVNRTYSEGSLCSLITGPNYWKPITAGTLRPLFKAWMTCDSRPHRSSAVWSSTKTCVAPATHLGRRTAWPPLSRQFRQLKLITTRAHPPRTEAALPFSLSYSHPFSLSYSQMCTLDKSSRVHLGP